MDIGGLTAWPIAFFEEGGAEFRVYEVEAPRGFYQVWVKGAPADLEDGQDEIARLVGAVQWD